LFGGAEPRVGLGLHLHDEAPFVEALNLFRCQAKRPAAERSTEFHHGSRQIE
jgi:hypothetical protein